MGKSARFTHPAQAVWLTLAYYTVLAAALVLFCVWGVWTAAAVKPVMFGVGIMLLIPAFFLGASGMLLWWSRGWQWQLGSTAPALPPVNARGYLPAIHRAMATATRFFSQKISTVPFCLVSALLLFTGYELTVIFNGDTIIAASGSNGALATSYVHSYLAITWLFVTWNMLFVVFTVSWGVGVGVLASVASHHCSARLF